MLSKINWLCLFSGLAILFPRFIIAQSPGLKHYSVGDGLSSSTVYCAFQDSRGFMWFGTESGLNRFDGKTFEQFTMDDGLSDNEIFKIFEDTKGRIWFLNFNGHLSYYLNGKFYNDKTEAVLQKAFVGFFYQNYLEVKGIIYLISSGNHLVIINGLSVIKITIPLPARIGVAQLFKNKTDEVFLTTGEYLYQVINNSLVFKKADSRNVIHVANMESVERNNALFLTNDGVHFTTENKSELLIPDIKYNFLKSNYVISAREFNHEKLWINFWSKGALLFEKDRSGTYNFSQQILHGKSIHSVFIDKENNTWFTTASDGVYLLKEEELKILEYTKQDGLSADPVFVIKKDRENTIWVGGSDCYISKIYHDSILNIRLPTHPTTITTHLNDIIFDNKGGAYCASELAVFYIKNNAPPVIIPFLIAGKDDNFEPHVKTFSKNSRQEITGNASVGVFWVKERGKNSEKYFVSEFNNEDSKVRIFSQFFDHKDDLWVSTINGLCIWKNNSLINCVGKTELLKNRFTQIRETTDSILLLVSDGSGIIFFKNNHIINHLTKSQGLASNICRKIFVEGDTIWVATNLGLTKFNYRNNQFTDIRTLDVSDGLLSNDVKDICVDGGLIYVGTEKGLNVMQYNEHVSKNQPPVVYLHRFITGNQPINDSIPEEIPFNINPIRIYFKTPVFKNPEKILYQYTLSNKENEWIVTKNDFVEFSNLPPGKYVFRIKAKKINSDWGNPLQLQFSILPPYWQTWWFKIIIVVAIIILIIGGVQLYFKQKLERERLALEQHKLLTDERMRISSDIHDELGSGLTQIAILSEIIRKEQKIPLAIMQSIDKISRSSRELIDKMGEIVWALNKSNDSLKNLLAYLREYVLEFGETYNISVEINFPVSVTDQVVSAKFRRNIFLTTKEVLTNILKHAGADQLRFNVDVTGKLLQMKLIDNGKGFNPGTVESGNGLNNLKKRIEELGGKMEISSEKGVKSEMTFSVPL